jgi:hypothetical protein
MKGHLTTIVPFLEKVRLPVSRDQAMLLFVVLNETIMGFETYLAHSLNGTIRFREWIPIVCGPLFGVMLLAAFFIAPRKPKPALWTAVAALAGSIIVGVLGTYFHLVRSIRPFAAPGQRVTLDLLVWGPSVFAPPTFVLVGLLGLTALSRESQDDTGAFSLSLWQKLPLSKDQAYFWMACLGVLIALVSSLLDHMRTGFENPWLWIPALSGVFAVAVAAMLALLASPSRADLTVYALAMGLLLAVGPLGFVLHVLNDMGVGGTIVIERFLRGAPVLAPMVFANMGLLGVLVLLDPRPATRREDL